MQLTRLHTNRILQAAAVAAAAFSAACTVSKQDQPALSAPSGFGVSISGSASPDALPRDGQSTSVLRLTVQTYQGEAVSSQQLTVATSAGTVTPEKVTTDGNGVATVQLTAPPATSAASEAVVQVTSIGGEFGGATSAPRLLTVTLYGPSAPVPSFRSSPAAPRAGDVVSLNASATTLAGAPCFDQCEYQWDFGDGDSVATHQAVVNHRFKAAGAYVVRLTAVSPDGIAATTSGTVSIDTPAAITADFTVSPTAPKAAQSVYFDAGLSKTPDGAAITSYHWEWGDGKSAGTKQVDSHVFDAAGTYTVRLTITDEGGRTASTTKTVAVTN